MIEIKDASKTYRIGTNSIRALDSVSLKIEEGEFVAITGPSGSGKSTLMHILGLLDVPDSGSYRFSGQEVSRLSQDQLSSIRGRVIGFVFQQFNLLSRTRSIDNVSLPLLYLGNGHSKKDPSQLLDMVGLGSWKEHKSNELSGGQQQRVAIARALVNNPKFILADEPTGNLDSKTGREILDMLKKLNREGITIILVTHDENIAKEARRVIRMCDGQIEEDERLGEPSLPSNKKNETSLVQLLDSHHRFISFGEMKDHVRQAARSLLANKVRSGLSMLGVLIGVMAVIAMLAVGRGAQKSMEQELSDLGTNILMVRPGAARSKGVRLEAGSVTRFTVKDAEEMKATIPSIQYVAPMVQGNGQVVFGHNNWNTRIVGTTPSYAQMKSYEPEIGRFFNEEELKTRARVAVVGMTIVGKIFDNQNPVGEFIKINKVSFQVVGVFPEKGASFHGDLDDTIIIPLSTAMRRLLGKDYVEDIQIKVRSQEEMANVEAQVKALIIKRHHLAPSKEDSFEIRNMAEIQDMLSSTTQTMTLLLSGIAIVSLFVGGIGIMNIMLVSVTERTREIGLRKAVGARVKDILSQFLIESLVISLAGGLSGALLGVGVAHLMSFLAGWPVLVSFSSIVLAFLFSASVGIVFGLWPARKASQLNPIQALRYE